MYEYSARLRRVIDGDTVSLDIDLGFGIWQMDETVRLLGINCPEMKTEAGKVARDFTLHWLEERAAKPLRIQTTRDKREKYGRMLGTIYVDSECLNSWLVISGNAVEKTY